MYLCADESLESHSVPSDKRNGNMTYLEKLQNLILQRLEANGQSHKMISNAMSERLSSVEAVLGEVRTNMQRLLVKCEESDAALSFQPGFTPPKKEKEQRMCSFEDSPNSARDSVNEPLPNEFDSMLDPSDMGFDSSMDERLGLNEGLGLDEQASHLVLKPLTSSAPRSLSRGETPSPLEKPTSMALQASPRSLSMSPPVQARQVETDELDDVVPMETRESTRTDGSLSDAPAGDATTRKRSSAGTGVSSQQSERLRVTGDASQQSGRLKDDDEQDLWYQTRHAEFNPQRKSVVVRLRQSVVGRIRQSVMPDRRDSSMNIDPSMSVTSSASDYSPRRSTDSRGCESIITGRPKGVHHATPRFQLLPAWARLRDAANADGRNKKTSESDEDSDDSDVSTHLPRTVAWATPHVYQRQRARSLLGETSTRSERCLENCMASIMISPWSGKRTVWDVLAICFISYDAITLPMQVFPIGEEFILQFMGWVCTLYWTIDLLVGCITGYVEPKSDRVELRPLHVISKYSRTWLFFNILAVAPDWIGVALGGVGGDMQGVGRTVKVVRTLRILRLLRLVKMRSVLIMFEKRFNNDYLMCYLNLVKLMICMAVLVHYLACGWFGVNELENDNGWAAQDKFDSTDAGYKYLTSLHWSLTQFQGSMEVHPMTTIERGYAVVVLYLGVVAAGGFISTITNSMTRIQQIYAEVNNRRWVLLRYLSDNNINGLLSVRVKNWVEKALKDERTKAGEVELLRILPEDLRMDLELDSHKRVFAVHPLLYFLTQADLNLARHLGVCFDALRVHPQEPMFDSDSSAEGMYIVMSGKLLYSNLDAPMTVEKTRSNKSRFDIGARAQSTVARATIGARATMVALGHMGKTESETRQSAKTTTVEAPAVLCEMALWTRWDHTGNCSATYMTEVFVLASDKFREAVVSHSDQGIRVLRYAINFVNWMNSRGRQLDDVTSPLKGSNDDDSEPGDEY